MGKSHDYKQGYRDAIQFAISEINENIETYLITEEVGDKIIENLETIFRKVSQK